MFAVMDAVTSLCTTPGQLGSPAPEPCVIQVTRALKVGRGQPAAAPGLEW